MYSQHVSTEINTEYMGTVTTSHLFNPYYYVLLCINPYYYNAFGL